MGLIHPYQFTTHILKTATTGEDFCATVVSISGTDATADRNGPFSVRKNDQNFFSSESEFNEIVFTIECQYQTDGLCP